MKSDIALAKSPPSQFPLVPRQLAINRLQMWKGMARPIEGEVHDISVDYGFGYTELILPSSCSISVKSPLGVWKQVVQPKPRESFTQVRLNALSTKAHSWLHLGETKVARVIGQVYRVVTKNDVFASVRVGSIAGDYFVDVSLRRDCLNQRRVDLPPLLSKEMDFPFELGEELSSLSDLDKIVREQQRKKGIEMRAYFETFFDELHVEWEHMEYNKNDFFSEQELQEGTDLFDVVQVSEAKETWPVFLFLEMSKNLNSEIVVRLVGVKPGEEEEEEEYVH